MRTIGGRVLGVGAAVWLASLLGCGDDEPADGESTTSTETTAADTTESSTTASFEECQDPVTGDVELQLVLDPPFSDSDAAGVQYSGTCTLTAIEQPLPATLEMSFSCTGAGGPAADWSLTATITGLAGMPPSQLLPEAEVAVAIAYAAAESEIVSLGLNVAGDLVLAASSGNVIEAPGVDDPQALWSPLHVTAPADQQCPASGDCAARNRLIFEGISTASLDVFDHHAVATGTYDILLGRALTPIVDCEGTNAAWYDFVLLRTQD